MQILTSFYALQASENLGMAMIYTLVSSAKEWLSERYGQDSDADNAEEEEATKDEVWPFIMHFISSVIVGRFLLDSRVNLTFVFLAIL